jgi:hypothetical protein
MVLTRESTLGVDTDFNDRTGRITKFDVRGGIESLG